MNPLVHTKETTDGATLSSSYRAFKGSKHFVEIQKIREIYLLLGKRSDGDFLDRLDRCSELAWFVRHRETGEVRVKASSCHIRHCPICNESRQQFITAQAKTWLDRTKYPKLLTLTIKHSDLDLNEQIDHLYKSFQKLRKRKFFSSRVLGGMWFFQIKKSKADGFWHPHLHVLISGRFLLHSELVTLWNDITGDSKIVDIRAVEDSEKSAKHIARYAVKPGNILEFSLDDACDMIAALKGRRLVGVFGTAKNVSLRPARDETSSEWESVGSWNFVVNLSKTNQRSQAILNAYFLHQPLDDGNSLDEVERQVYDAYIAEERPPPKIDPTFFSRTG